MYVCFGTDTVLQTIRINGFFDTDNSKSFYVLSNEFISFLTSVFKVVMYSRLDQGDHDIALWL
jgi:hypothetical protein